MIKDTMIGPCPNCGCDHQITKMIDGSYVRTYDPVTDTEEWIGPLSKHMAALVAEGLEGKRQIRVYHKSELLGVDKQAGRARLAANILAETWTALGSDYTDYAVVWNAKEYLFDAADALDSNLSGEQASLPETCRSNRL